MLLTTRSVPSCNDFYVLKNESSIYLLYYNEILRSLGCLKKQKDTSESFLPECCSCMFKNGNLFQRK